MLVYKLCTLFVVVSQIIYIYGVLDLPSVFVFIDLNKTTSIYPVKNKENENQLTLTVGMELDNLSMS